MILMLLCMICIYECVYMWSLYLCILLCNRAPWKNSVTEWFTLYKHIWNKVKKIKFYRNWVWAPIYLLYISCTLVERAFHIFVNSSRESLVRFKHNSDENDDDRFIALFDIYVDLCFLEVMIYRLYDIFLLVITSVSLLINNRNNDKS